MSSTLVEIIACSVQDALNAQEGGASRLELCSAYELGGVTPSYGLFDSVIDACSLPLAVLVRPRPGGFAYEAREIDTICRDILWFAKRGASAIVCGALNADQTAIHRDFMKQIREACDGTNLVCHRCFDVVVEPIETLALLAEIGVSRVLTSGQQPTASEGAELISQLVRAAPPSFEILAGGGIRSQNVRSLVEHTGVREVHASAFLQVPSGTNRPVDFGNHNVVSSQLVAGLVAATRESIP